MVQRMLAARDERGAFLAVLWFCFVHYVLRPWPWVLVGLVTLVAFPDLADRETGYPMAIVAFLPAGLLGVMVASMIAAFMSTIDTLLNWGSSLMVNDLYRPLRRRPADERHDVRAAQLSVLLLMAAGGITAYLMQSIRGAWELFFGMTVGIGGVYVARWWWWRVNAWSEIAAWLSTAAVYVGLHVAQPGIEVGWHLIVTALASTACWIVVALTTPPTDEAVLVAFYERVRPSTPGWGPIARRSREPPAPGGCADLVGWLAGLVCLYAGMFGVGKLILHGWWTGAPYLAVAAVASGVIVWSVGLHARFSPASGSP
jgi:Na+/proline symporter